MNEHEDNGIGMDEVTGTWVGGCTCGTRITTRTEAHTRDELEKHVETLNRQEQLEDALEVVEAIIASDTAHDVWQEADHQCGVSIWDEHTQTFKRRVTRDESHSLWKSWLAEMDRAHELTELYRARYAHTR